ncbi:MAG: acyltransferase [Verrucomicrobia bacterium]|nr:acyltransferase [Verrucomicrobiota bacterium]
MKIKVPASLQGVGLGAAARYAFYRVRWAAIAGTWYKLWHQNVFIGRGVHINSLSTGGVVLGDRVTLGDYSWVQGTAHLNNPGESLVVEEHVYIGPFAVLGFHGPVRIGAHTAIGAGFRLSAQEHNLDEIEIATKAGRGTGIDIGRHCWFGNDVKVLDGVRIGDHCVVGAGAVVTRSLPRGAVAAGVPARVIRVRDL